MPVFLNKEIYLLAVPSPSASLAESSDKLKLSDLELASVTETGLLKK